MRREPPVNLHRFAANITLDATLLRWFAYNGRRDEVMAAIEIKLTRAKDTEGQVLDFLVRYWGQQRPRLDLNQILLRSAR